MKLIFREATIDDIPQLQIVRNSVIENALSNPALATYEHYEVYLTQYGKGWVCKTENTIVAFAIADVQQNNIWALFVLPEYEKHGIGKQLHSTMVSWYFNQTETTVWLSTAPNTRAYKFYRSQGWTETGLYGKSEILFEMMACTWKKLHP